jgi:hypothetical protein
VVYFVLTLCVACRLWVLKYAILEFFRRLNVTWRRTYDLALMFIRGLLITTFIAVVISDLVECQPFSHYWQALPDPGGQCRQGYAQLLTMAVCNVVTDLSLVLFPVPVILSSSMTAKRKLQLVLLFSLSLAPVIVTIYRVPHIIREHGSQQTRSLFASIELLFATAAANALVLGSFVRDRGVKKRRFKYDSIAAGSIDRSSASESRRPTALKHWGSDEDLVRDLGLGVKPELRDVNPSPTDQNRHYTPAPPVHLHQDMNAWRFPGAYVRPSISLGEDAGDKSTRSDSSATHHRRVSFFDYGGLLDDTPPTTATMAAVTNNRRDGSPSSGTSSSGGSPTRPPEPVVPASGNGFRRGSAALLQDLGGLLAPPGSRQAKLSPKQLNKTRAGAAAGGELSPIQQARDEGSKSPSPQREEAEKREPQEPQLMDVGGLLAPPK